MRITFLLSGVVTVDCVSLMFNMDSILCNIPYSDITAVCKFLHDATGGSWLLHLDVAVQKRCLLRGCHGATGCSEMNRDMLGN